MDATLANQCAEFTTAVNCLSPLSAYDALIPFKSSLSAPKMIHMLRCSQCTEHPSLQEIDNILRKGICAIANLDLTDLQWLQASLPVNEGGLGVQYVVLPHRHLLLFLASAASTEPLQQQLLLRSLADGTSHITVVSIRDIWSSVCNLPGPSGTAAYKQSAWDKMTVASECDSLSNSLSDTTDKARLLAVTSPHSYDWLHALPLSSCSLCLDDNAVHVAVGLRLGANICKPHQCLCGAASMPEDFMDSHVKVAVADPFDTIASTTWCGAVYQWCTLPQPWSRRVFSGPMESDPMDLH